MSNRKVVLLNPQGLRTQGRLSALLFEARNDKVEILIITEHNIDFASKSRAEREARRKGFIPCIGFARDRGGSAIFVFAQAFGLEPTDLIPYTAHLDGRVTVADIPTPSEDPKHAGTLRVCGLYVPAGATDRRIFLTRLAKAKCVTRKIDVLGTDANCVADPQLDVRYPKGATHTYSNAHANTLELILAKAGLRDLHRTMHGDRTRGGFTRETATIATRIDRLYTRTRATDVEWHDIRVNASFGRSQWNPDHRAVQATFAHCRGVEQEPGDPSIARTIYSDPFAYKTVQQMFREHETIHSTEAYGAVCSWEMFKPSARLHLTKLTQHARPKASGKAVLLNSMLNALASRDADPSSERHRQQGRIQSELQEHKGAYRGKRGRHAHAKIDREERCSKPFFNQYKPNLTKKPIASLHEMRGVNLKLTHQSEPDSTTTRTGNEELSCIASDYYRNLMDAKPSDPAASKVLTDEIERKPFSAKAAKSIEGAITEKEVRKAIRSMANGKAPGPDGLHAEFFKEHEHLLVSKLTDVFNEMHKYGHLADTMREGNIILLFKKKDPRDIRNYRPITLLNTDYKILTKILVARLKSIINSFVSSPQTGFVPKRQITDNTLLLRLIQAYLDETDEEGLLLFLDLEKAFDRVSHEFLHKATRAAGLGPDMMRWIETIYSLDCPVKRRTVVNGRKSDWFPIKSGVAQGCPLSPILFLFVTEGLTRLLANDTNIPGIKVGKVEHKISQFADDTVLLLRNFRGINRIFKHTLKIYEDATGMRVNVSKTEGLTLGKLRNKPVPNSIPNISWCPEGSYIISLGVPIGNSFDERAFWLTKYNKCKSLLARWTELDRTTIYGRAMLANAMVLSRFRYWAQTMHIPPDIRTAIQEDVQAMIWNKETAFDVEELGTLRSNRRWISDKAQYNPKKEGGISLLHWPAHCLALEANLWLRYRDGSQAAWKQVLDQWVANRFFEQRGAPFTTIPVSALLLPLSSSRSALPKILAHGLRAFRELNLTPSSLKPFASKEEARAEPAWCSHRITLKRTNHAEAWRTDFHLNRLQDLLLQTDDAPPTEWPRADLLDYFEDRVQTFIKAKSFLQTKIENVGQPLTLLYKVPLKSTGKNFVTNVYCFYL